MGGSRLWGLGNFAGGENEVLHMNFWCTVGRQFGIARQSLRCLVRSRLRFWLLCDGALWFLFECAPLIFCNFIHDR